MRIAAHTFGPNRPARDLRVSPGHAICVDVLGEVLIPAGALVNGSTIQQVEGDGTAHSLADYCRPFHAGGHIVETARAQLQARMEVLRRQQIPLQVAS